MAEEKHHSSKRNNKQTRPPSGISCFSLKACFGEKREPSEGRLGKYRTRRASGRASTRTVPISQPPVPSPFGEIQEIEAVETRVGQSTVAPLSQEPIRNRKNKNGSKASDQRMGTPTKYDHQNSTNQETWSSPLRLKHSVSLPPKQMKSEKSTASSGKNSKNGSKSIIISDQLDPTVGAFIVMSTLIVMLIWGKLCAIMCTAAWFYIVPRFQANLKVKVLENGSKHIDVDSWEYKRRVVLEGLLGRY